VRSFLPGEVPSLLRRDPHQRGTTRVGFFLLAVVLTVAFSVDPAVALPPTSTPHLHLARIIRTTPFAKTTVSMRDGEGSAYVPRDRSLWLADDNGQAVYEVNAATGALKRVIGRSRFGSAMRHGGGPVAGPDRTRDLESVAYDRNHDALFVFSGSCCSPSVKPTVFRLKRNSRGKLSVESFQPLPSSANDTAAAWNVANGKLYVGYDTSLRTYHYGANTLGPVFGVPNVSGITGMSFTPNGADLFITTKAQKLRRVRWATKRLVPGWTFGLTRFGIRDGRAVELIGGRFYVLDGYDGRSEADPRKYAVYVFDVS
jgi:hypothetical protein